VLLKIPTLPLEIYNLRSLALVVRLANPPRTVYLLDLLGAYPPPGTCPCVVIAHRDKANPYSPASPLAPQGPVLSPLPSPLLPSPLPPPPTPFPFLCPPPLSLLLLVVVRSFPSFNGVFPPAQDLLALLVILSSFGRLCVVGHSSLP